MPISNKEKLRRIREVLSETKSEILCLRHKKDLSGYGQGTLDMIRLIEEILNK
jgi:hypothetical protein